MSRRPRIFRWRDEKPVAERLQRSNPVRLGIVLLIITALVVYFGFTKHVPFTHGFRLKAQFSSVLNIAPKSPVRTAGVPVGEVKSIQREGNTGVVTMEIENQGLPVHTDATVKIRPRIFLEGNYFVELQPGTPSAPTVSSGYTIPITQTADPVQIDQVLAALNSDTRQNLQTFLAEFGSALTAKPTAAQDAEQDPEVHGLNAAQALNKAIQHSPEALRGGAIVGQALGGTEQHDLSKFVAATEHLTAELNVHEQQLGELFPNFDIFLGSLAAQSASLSSAVAQLPGSLTTADRAFASIQHASPSVRAFALALASGFEQTPATIKAAYPWIAQAQALLGPQELAGLAQSLRAGAPTLAALVGSFPSFFNQAELIGKCVSQVLQPAGEIKIQDSSGSAGIGNQWEFFNALVGLNAGGKSFDGNGYYQRLIIAGGNQTIVPPPTTLPGTSLKGFQVAGTTALAPLGTRPRVPTVEPPYKPLVPCYTQPLPNLNGPLAQGPADGSAG